MVISLEDRNVVSSDKTYLLSLNRYHFNRHLKRRRCETILGGKNLGYFSFELFPLFSLFDTVLYQGNDLFELFFYKKKGGKKRRKLYRY